MVERYADVALELFQLAHRDASELAREAKAFEATPTREAYIRLQSLWVRAAQSLAASAGVILPGGAVQDFDRRVRAWPVSPKYLDGTPEEPEAGLLQGAEPVTKSMLISRHQNRYRFNVTLGIYAIERMLYGPSPSKSLERFEALSSAPQAERRRKYLRLASEIYADDLKALSSSFNSRIGGSFASRLIKASSKKVVQAILKELHRVALDEIAIAQIRKPIEMRNDQMAVNQFADTSLQHLFAKLKGWEQIYLGQLEEAGPGLSELVALRNPKLDLEIKETIELARRNLRRIDRNFDQLLRDSEGRSKLSGQAELFEELAGLTKEAASEIDIKI